MDFKNFNKKFHNNKKVQEIQTQEIILAEGVTSKSFINAVKQYKSIDDALLHLSDENVEFYLLNINSKEINNLLKKNKIQGLQETEITLGMAPGSDKQQNIYKNLKYKGQYITLEYNPELQSWFPTLRFRSIITALKYIKKQVDYNEENV